MISRLHNDATFVDEGLQNLAVCSAPNTIEQGGRELYRKRLLHTCMIRDFGFCGLTGYTNLFSHRLRQGMGTEDLF